MRIWDIDVKLLCNKHLIAQHYEIHCIYNIVTKKRKGFSNHPEVNKWRGHLGQLVQIHQCTVEEMIHRNYNHKSPLSFPQGYYMFQYVAPWQPIDEQIKILRLKGCGCKISSEVDNETRN